MSGIYVSDYGGGDSFFSQDFFYDGFSVKNDVFSLFYRIRKKLFPSKSIAAVNQKDAPQRLDRKRASSRAVFPPPMTAATLPRKKAPSQVAQ